MEYFDVYDQNGEKLDKTMLRGTSTKKGEYHRVVHIWIENQEGKYLVQQRNKSTDKYPFQWAPTAGAVIAGENSFDAAIRETFEEIGLSLNKDELDYKGVFFNNNQKANYIVDIFLVKKDIKLGGLILDFKEVKNVNYLNKEKIYEMIAKNQFWNFESKELEKEYFAVLEKR